MIKLIKANLDRQSKAVLLLSMLLQEEFSLLMKKATQGVTSVELVIQELMRLISAERMSLRLFVQKFDPSAQRLGQVLPAIEDGQRKEIEKLLARIDEHEQKCGVQASKNHQMAQALLEQSSSMLDFLHKEITPKEQNVYSARGRYFNPKPQASLINGRL